MYNDAHDAHALNSASGEDKAICVYGSVHHWRSGNIHIRLLGKKVSGGTSWADIGPGWLLVDGRVYAC